MAHTALRGKKLKPVLEGDWWLIGPSPDIDSLISDPVEIKQRHGGLGRPEKNAPVDHHIFQGPDDKWHCWGCVRATNAGRVLYHWEAAQVTDSPWRSTGELIRVDKSYGESLGAGDELIQSPFFVKHDERYFMFYGGGSTGIKEVGPPERPRTRMQMCLMTSADGRNWERHRNEAGQSRVFAGPAGTRDPCLLQIDGLWHIYYCAASEESGWQSATFLRTSVDLINWSDNELVHHDAEYVFATETKKTAIECPFVVYRSGYYYLFRTVDYYSGETHVFRSSDPHDFGVGDVRDRHVCRIRVAAPEIYSINGRQYISSSHNPPLGEQMCRLRWVEDTN
jgi:hypothetical protein